MSDPVFSIAVPVHNGANFLAGALESIKNQSTGEFECVISDNASTDSTPDILADFQHRDARFRWSRTDRLIPVTENFNRAGSLAHGRWIVFLSHDDSLHFNCIERLTAAVGEFGSDRLGLIGFGETHLFDNGFVGPPTTLNGPPLRYYNGRQFVRQMLSGKGPDALPGSGNSAVRRDLWERFGQFDKRFLHCDIFLWHRILVDYDYLLVAEPLLRRRIHAHQDSVGIRQIGRSIEEYRTFFPEFLRQHQEELRLPAWVRILAERRYLSVAATEILIQLAKGSPKRALQLLGMVPWKGYPMLAALILRNSYREAARTRSVRRRVPIQMLYPG